MAFFWRLAALVALMGVVAWIDWRRHPAQATKWREYGFLFLAGFIGGAFGIAIDEVTATISSDYFVLGKGIPAGDHFRLQIASFGFQAGLAMGMVVGGIYLIANNPQSRLRSLTTLHLFRFASAPILMALLLAPIGALAVSHWDPLNLRYELGDLLSPIQIVRFRIVWGIHLGIYSGGLLGAICGVAALRRKRFEITITDAPHAARS